MIQTIMADLNGGFYTAPAPPAAAQVWDLNNVVGLLFNHSNSLSQITY